MIAFVAQLIVFVVQTGAANAQLLQSRQLHAELLRLLAEMSERARGTEATVTTMNERLLEAALGKALGTGGGRGSQAQVIASEVASLLDIPSRRVEGSDRLRAARVEDDLMPVVDQEARDRARQVLMTFPEGPVDEAIGALDQLSPEGRSELAAYGEDELWWSGTSIGPGQIPQHAGKELIDAGLLVPRQQGSQMHVLSDVGREAARLLIAEGKPPAHLADAVSRLRASLRQGDTPE